jgi:peptide/nickel transport system permease protein
MTHHVETIAAPRFHLTVSTVPHWVRVTWLFVRRKPLGAAGGAIVLVLLIMAVFAEWIAPYHYNEPFLEARLQSSSRAFWLGTDNLGRDMFSRIVYGARVSVMVGFGAVLLAILLATVVGVSSAYFGGVYDISTQRIVDAWQSFPFLVIILSIVAVLGPGIVNLIVAIGILAGSAASRVIRGATLAVLTNTYVEAARAMGCSHNRIILRYILPNVMATIIVLATILLGGVILVEAALSFLGYGVPPPFPSWGAMLSGSGRSYMHRAPWMAIWPGVAISLAVFGFNMLGDALRDVLDPRLRGSTGGAIR